MSTPLHHGAAASALLDSAESTLRARPLRSWQAAQKDAVRERLAAVHRDWCAEWLPARATVSPSDVEVGEPDGALVMSTDDVVCWSFTGAPRRDPTQAALQAIGERMFAFDMASASAAPAPAAIAPAVVRAAWADWLQRLDALWPGFSLEPQQPKGTPGTHVPADPWSGALVASWPWCGGTWCLGLPHAVVQALLGSKAATRPPTAPPVQRLPKERLDKALAAEPVALRVMLDGAELNLGQLQELRLDDVVPLGHLLDAPALVVAADGTPVCHGWLGQSAGRLAVELVPQNPNAHPLKENTP
jgi:hypothetical protein